MWLFSVAAGVANACALGEPARQADGHHAASEVSSHHHGDDEGGFARLNCLDFCEKSSVAAPQLKLVDDATLFLGCALAPVAYLSAPHPAEPVVDWLVVDSPHLRGGPPLRIAYQRLAL